MEMLLPWLTKLSPEYALLAFLVFAFMSTMTAIWTGAQQATLKAYDARIGTLEQALQDANKAKEAEKTLRRVCEDARKLLEVAIQELKTEIEVLKRRLTHEQRRVAALEQKLKQHEEAA